MGRIICFASVEGCYSLIRSLLSMLLLFVTESEFFFFFVFIKQTVPILDNHCQIQNFSKMKDMLIGLYEMNKMNNVFFANVTLFHTYSDR